MPELRIFYDPAAPPVVPAAVTFETGAGLADIVDPLRWAYEHHGSEFGPATPGALTCLFEDLAMGRPTPAAFVVNKVGDVDTLVAATLFLYRHLVMHPRTAGLVGQVDFVHRRGFPFLAHLDDGLGRFIRLLRGHFPDGLTAQQVTDRLPRAIEWVRSYMETEALPSLGALFPTPTVLDTGPDGFVVGETTGSLPEAWIELYRQGYYQGVLFGARVDTLLPVLVSRKSAFVPLALEQAAFILNEIEVSLGGQPQWKVSGDWLWGPPKGSLILATEVVRQVLRVRIPLLGDQ